MHTIATGLPILDSNIHAALAVIIDNDDAGCDRGRRGLVVVVADRTF